ncbi:uncharacterized protein LOC113307398 [Papaver somniferum]|uniref:uncharacterized protein LOC113307398 n=1 Tax=Papaver somniferum TaxID=3469 RepID=UPI000E700B35|nr:uncharacterized protein LOC113307398 [Papaver somniferum]
MTRDLKIYVCDYWRNLTPRSISFRHGQGCNKAVINCDYSLQGLIVTCSKELASFDLFVEEVSNGGVSSSSSGISTQSLSDDESCSGFTETSKIKYLTEGHEEDIFRGVGQVFHGGVEELCLAVDKYCSKSGYTVAKLKNDRLRFTTKCGRDADYTWHLHAIPIDTAKTVFAIKEFDGNHTCDGAYKLKYPPEKRKFIKHIFKDQIQSNPSIKPKDMVAQQQRLPILAAILSLNIIKRLNGLRGFSYVLLPVSKNTDCDAIFLTGRFRGTLLAATGVFPFVFVLVPSEDIEGWEWFIENLQHCVDSRPITFITDRHERLKQSIPKYFPNSYHSYCFYHLKNNLPIKKGHEKYKQVLELFHKAAYCYSVAKYESALNEMCTIGCGWVPKYIRNIDPKHWENAFFVGCRYDTHSSSIAESFNNWIHRERDLPPADLVDELRIKIMRMSSERHELGRNYQDSLTPIYKDLLKSHVDIGLPWNVTESGNGIYEVHSPSSHDVDLMQMTCTC